MNVFVIALALLAVRRLALLSGSRALLSGLSFAGLVLLLIPLNALRQCVATSGHLEHPTEWLPLLSAAGKALLVAALVLLAAAALRYRRFLIQVVETLLICLFPVFPLIAAQAIWRIATTPAVPTYPRLAAPYNPAPAASHAPLTRVVWIVFDEWDYQLTFQDPRGIGERGELGRFARQALFANHAFPPGGRTAVSLPALLAGRLISESTARGPSELMVRFEEKPAVEMWGAQDSLLGWLHTQSARTRVVGWWLPYSRVFGGITEASERQVEGFSITGTGFAEIERNQLRSLFETISASLFGQSLTAIQYKDCYQSLRSEGLPAAADARYDFVLLHMTGGHKPFSYDANTGRFTLRNSPNAGYFDALQLLDRTLGEIRTAMESAGVWDRTAVILSSDHWFRGVTQLHRPLDHRVPFLVKLPGQSGRLDYDKPFNTVLTRGLIEAIAQGRITAPEAVAQFLDEHRGKLGPSPYYAR